jgi:hypothetical protein
MDPGIAAAAFSGSAFQLNDAENGYLIRGCCSRQEKARSMSPSVSNAVREGFGTSI